MMISIMNYDKRPSIFIAVARSVSFLVVLVVAETNTASQNHSVGGFGCKIGPKNAQKTFFAKMDPNVSYMVKNAF